VSREGPIPLSSDLERFLEALGVPQISLLVSLHKAWPRIAGPLLAGKTFPLKFRNGVLTIGVPNHSWAQELQMSRSPLLARIAEALGEKSPVTDLRFAVGQPEAPEREARPRHRDPEAPPIAPEPEGLAGVSDPETRESLLAIQRGAGRPHPPSRG